MRGVFKHGKYWVVKYGSEYLGSFKNKQAEKNILNKGEI